MPAQPLTLEMQRYYFKGDGFRCPFCEGDNLKKGELIPDGFLTNRIVTCRTCREQWWEVFELVKIEK